MSNCFVPAKWLSNAHIQTIWPFIFRKVPALERQRERFETPDGDFFDVDWFGKGDKGIVILMHGLTGCSSSHYILGMQDALGQHGYRTAALNFRACSGEPNLKAGSYHAGFTQDIHQLYQTIRDVYPDMPIYTVGFSLGGNIMLKWLGKKANEIIINGSVAVSVPYKLDNCADKVDAGLSRVYRHHLISSMKAKLARKLTYFTNNNLPKEAEKLRELGDITGIKSFWEFDNDVVARLHGFDDVHDYYQRNSSISFLKDIKTNTLLIHAKDDPFMTPDVMPNREQLSSTITCEITNKGGHVGFIGRPTSKQFVYWLEERIVKFLTEQGR
jgi:hypothetical protein